VADDIYRAKITVDEPVLAVVKTDETSGTVAVSSVGRKGDTGSAISSYEITIGDAGNTQFTIIHNLNTRDVVVQVYEMTSPYETVLADIQRLTTNTALVTFANAPALNEYRVVVLSPF
jgi:hypothetical protein